MTKTKLLVGIFISLVGFGLLSFPVAGQVDEAMANILSSLSKDEVIIELAYYEGTKDKEIAAGLERKEEGGAIKKTRLGKVASCLSIFKEKARGLVSSQSMQGMLIMDGMVIEKKTEYIIFKTNLKFTNEDKNRKWEMRTRLKLMKGKEKIVGGMKKPSMEEWQVTIKATW